MSISLACVCASHKDIALNRVPLLALATHRERSPASPLRIVILKTFWTTKFTIMIASSGKFGYAFPKTAPDWSTDISRSAAPSPG